MTMPLRGTAALIAAMTLSVVLAACGSDATTGAEDGPTASGPASTAVQVEAVHNQADVTFAQGMLPHHRQAVEMSELALTRAEDPEVVELAEEISAAQGPEIRTMASFLATWGAGGPDEGASVPGMESDGMDDMSAGGMAGMTTPEDMTELRSAEGADFDRLFLELMVEHHEGAVDMAETELEEGENPSALDLAQTIIDTQEAEIQRMQGLLDS